MIDAVIVTHGQPDLVARAAESLRRSEPKLASMTIVDTASNTDVDHLQSDVSLEATLIRRPENPGFGCAANIGIEVGHAPFVLVANSDTWAHPGAVARLTRVLEASPDVACVGPLLLNTDGSPQDSAFAFPGIGQAVFDLVPLPDRLRGSRLNGRRWSKAKPIDVSYVLGAFMLVRRRAIHLVGSFSPDYWMYSEEIDICRRFWSAGWRVMHVPLAHVTHIRAASTSDGDLELLPQLYRSRARWYRRHRAAPITYLALALMWLALTVRALLPGPRRRAYAEARAALRSD
jgi:GT2 family glycosyltransferase